MAYGLLFLVAFGSATLLPMQSEAVFLALLANEKWPLLLILLASSGNVLGSCVNFWLGQHLERYQDKAWFPVSQARLAKAQKFYHTYGYWSLLASWVPLLGDPITLFAGVLGEKFWRFLVIVTLAKTGRYVALYAIYQGLV